MMTIYAGTGDEKLPELVRLTADEIRRVAEDLSESEVTRARAQTKAGLVMGLESVSARAERLAAMLSIWGRVPPLAETVERIDAVGVTEARAAAERLAGAEPGLVLYGPVGQAGPDGAFAARLVA